MTTSRPSMEGNDAITWVDINNNRKIDAHNKRNNYGFSMDFDLVYGEKYEKKPNEKVVIITGGSVVQGIGATSNEMNVAGRIQYYLNKLQNKYSYTVLNFGNSGWNAYQSYIALNLWGMEFSPDWIITMNGYNDIAVTCAESQGAINPAHFFKMKRYIDNFLSKQSNPPYYRGFLENELIKHSFAYRMLTGKEYLTDDAYFVTEGRFQREGEKASWDDVTKAIKFYLNASNSIMKLSNHAKYIFSLTPVIYVDTSNYSRTDAQLDHISAEMSEKGCNAAEFSDADLPYFMSKTHNGLQNLVASYKADKESYFLNISNYLPETMDERKSYFIDAIHFTDKGHDAIGRIFAYTILKSDFPEQATKYSEKLNKESFTESLPPETIRNIFATYGGNCKNVIIGNATKHVSKECKGKRECEYIVDVNKLGDPAQGCGKEFEVEWKCGRDAKVQKLTLPAEAGLGSSAKLSCGIPVKQISNSGINIVEANYGANCGAKAGNATESVNNNCFGKDSCEYTVDVNKLGDPAPGCGKEFEVEWKCGRDAKVQKLTLPAEAGIKSKANLTCPIEEMHGPKN